MKRVPALKFCSNVAEETGCSVASLTYNEDRPNISILTRRTGTVDLTSRLAREKAGNGLSAIPKSFPTFIFRNYAVVKDGLVNVEKLPIRVTPATAKKLTKDLPEDAIYSQAKSGKYVEFIVNLRALPVINRKMVREASATALFRKQWELENVRAAQKVYKFYEAMVSEKKESVSFKLTYGEDGAQWLKDLGFTDYSGFCPRVLTAEATDFYMGKELTVSLKGLSSLPKVEDVKERMASSKKQTTAGSLMVPWIEEVEAALGLLGKSAAFKTWIERRQEDADKQRRRLLGEIARIKFVVVVGQVWFKEFATLEENSMTMTFGEIRDLPCKVEMKEVKIEI